MAKKYYNGGVLTTVATTDVKSGDVVSFEDSIGVVQQGGATGELITIDTEGVYLIPCKTGTDFALGQRVAFNAANKIITDASPASGIVNAGTVWEEYKAASGNGSVFVKING